VQKQEIIHELKRRGKRITEQRKLLLDVILKNPHRSIKELYYEVSKKDSSIGIATVYRMVNLLEEIGAVNRTYANPLLYRAELGNDRPNGIYIVKGNNISEQISNDLYESIKAIFTDRGLMEQSQDFFATIVFDS